MPELEAGRELDALIAESMGWKWESDSDAPAPGWAIMHVPGTMWCAAERNDKEVRYTDFLPRYSTEPAAAWLVVEKLCTDGREFQLVREDMPKPWMAEFSGVAREGGSAAHAICLAALAAVLPSQQKGATAE